VGVSLEYRMRAVFEHFTPRANRVIEKAEQEALRLSHDHVALGHLLLGLLSQDSAAAARTFGRIDRARRVVLRHLNGTTVVQHPISEPLPYSRQAKRSLEVALSRAGDQPVTTTHLLQAIRNVDPPYFQSVLAACDPSPPAQLVRRQGDAGHPPRARSGASKPHGELPPRSVGAVVLLFSSTCATGLAALVDIRAFTALATPALYAWCGLSAVCTFALIAIRALGRWGVYPPRYVWWVLTVGIAGGLFTLPTAWRVLTKHEQQPAAAVAGKAVDWRGRVIENESLTNASLRGAQLQDTIFRHVDLAGSDLAESDLRSSRFFGVDLSGANLCGADLRGADLRGAEHLEDVANWAYAFYDTHTKLPSTMEFALIAGPVPDTHRGLLYMCTPNDTHRIPAS
jgi:hypothetical protein